MDVTTILSLGIAASAVGVSLFAAVNARKSALQSLAQSMANGGVAHAIMAKASELESQLNGRLTALINSIRAQAESDALAAKAEAWLRESRAFGAGQESIRAIEPPATAAQVAELRVVTLAGAEAALRAKGALGLTEQQPVHVHVVTDESPVAVHVVPVPREANKEIP